MSRYGQVAASSGLTAHHGNTSGSGPVPVDRDRAVPLIGVGARSPLDRRESISLSDPTVSGEALLGR
jgi:hypothetical protein